MPTRGVIKDGLHGMDGSNKAEYCAPHAKEGMINLQSKRCSAEGCTTKASFGTDGTKKPEFCATHAKEGRVIVTLSLIHI